MSRFASCPAPPQGVCAHCERSAMTSNLTEIVVDCEGPDRLARFWREVLGWEETHRDDHSVYLESPDRSGPGLLFLKVPEGKRVKNRLHLDVSPRDVEQREEVERLKGLGAVEIDIGQGEVSWVVMADPEGNEFCVLSGRSS